MNGVIAIYMAPVPLPPQGNAFNTGDRYFDPRALFQVVHKYVGAKSEPIKERFPQKGRTNRVTTKLLSTISMQ